MRHGRLVETIFNNLQSNYDLKFSKLQLRK